MGCDIHIYREKLVDGQWISGDKWKEEEEWDGRISWVCEEIGDNRNYHLFSVLARVRCKIKPPTISFQPRGLPLRMSKEVEREEDDWGGYSHSQSHLYLHELEELLDALQSSTIKVTGAKDHKSLSELQKSIASNAPDWSLLYPYCKWCSYHTNYEYFEVDVPADFLCGKQLQEIIDGLKEIGGDMQRVVFWFDS